MGYRSNYKKSPYEFHGLKWDKFDEKIKITDIFLNQIEYDGYNKNWIPDSEYLKLYNTDGTKKLQENIIKNIVEKNLHSLL